VVRPARSRPARLLLLGGTAEASALARTLAGRPDVAVTTSFAGRTAQPLLPPGAVRIGGFGGVAGLVSYLRSEQVDLLVDATHPFAAVMRWHAAAAAAQVAVPRLRLERPGWSEGPHDTWQRVTSLEAAASVVAASPWRSVLLTTGRTGLGAFAPASDGRRRWVLRCIDPPVDVPLSPVTVVLDRGPFSLQGEVALLDAHTVDVVVTKDSGGPRAKLDAAALHGVAVVMVDRPPSPPGAQAASVEEALTWIGAAGYPAG
jgi:precorrin-6A/cobalt-precorrin-6A reductase